jgi:hypothetical protein
MDMVKGARRFTFAAATLSLAVFASPVWAQDVSETHLEAARSAISAMKATVEFDSILPQAAQALKNELIQKNPNLQETIIQVVDETAISLAARRGDLERESALAYARVFSEQQLKEIAEFYNSETGQKLIADGPIVVREIIQAAEIWQRGIARDLAQQVGEEIASREGTAPTAATPTPAGGDGSADDGAADE